MPEGTIRVAAVQIAPDLTSRAATMIRALDATEDAAAKGAQLVMFPETFAPAYPYFSFVLPPVQQGEPHLALMREAVTIPSPETEAMADAARRPPPRAGGGDRRDRARRRIALSCAADLRRGRDAGAAPPQDHADLS
ncbi:MAG: putative amidohydrolase [Paracoccaceae bacterium]|jgi:predicted amidohydrolase